MYGNKNMEYKTFKTEAIVLKERELAEKDKLFTVFSRRYGKIEILARSIRKTKAKLKGGFQVLNYLSLEFIKGKTFSIATDTIIKNEFPLLRSSVQKFRTSLYICDLMDKLIKGEEKDKRIWNLLLETLTNLQFTSCKLGICIRYFEWNLLSSLGFKPELYACVNCQEKVKTGKFFFSVKDGGILCQECEKKYGRQRNKLSSRRKFSPKIKELSKETIKILRLIINQDQKILNRLKVPSYLNQELKELSKFFLQYIAEEKLYMVL